MVILVQPVQRATWISRSSTTEGPAADVRQRLLHFHDGAAAPTTTHGYTPSTGGAPGRATDQMSPQLRHR
jgi:hypothetical protein